MSATLLSKPKSEFQQTELGIIPSDWTVHSLGQLFDITAGGDLVKSEFSPTQDDTYCFPIYANALRNRGLYGFSCSRRYTAGKITVTARGEIGHAEHRTEDFCAIGRLLVLAPRQPCSLKLISEYINNYVEFALESTGVPQLTAPQIAKYHVALPSDGCEQQAIAAALSDADALIEGLESLVAKKRAVKQGAMQELLSGRRRLAGFCGEWKEETFGDVFVFLPTATNARNDLSDEGDAAYVHYGDIHTRFHDILDFGRTPPPRIERRRCPNAATLKNGDWIMADASEDFDGVAKSVEVAGLTDCDVAVSGLHTFLLREKRLTFAPGFKGHLGNAKQLREQYLRVMTGMKVFGVSKAALRNLVIPVPEWKEQEAIRDVLNDMSDELVVLEARLDKACRIKQGMMQELLTGQVRLV